MKNNPILSLFCFMNTAVSILLLVFVTTTYSIHDDALKKAEEVEIRVNEIESVMNKEIIINVDFNLQEEINKKQNKGKKK